MLTLVSGIAYDPVELYQSWKQENAQNTEDLEQDNQDTFSGSACVRKLTRTVDTKETKMEFLNMKITDYQYLSNVFQFRQQKLGIKTGCVTFGIEATKTNILMWGLLMSSSMRAAIHLGLNHEENLETYKNMNFEQIETLFNITKKIDIE